VSCACKRELYLLSRNTNNPDLIRYYKKYCTVLIDLIKLANKCYYNKLILKSKNKIKTSWSIIRASTNTNLGKNTIPLINIEGKLCNNVQIMDNFINNYFTTLLPHMQFGRPSNVQAALNYLLKVFKNPFPNINMMPVTNKEIKDIVRSLKGKSSQGYDEIPQNILKLSLPFILSPLTYMCNKSLSLGIFPTRLKYSQINPIYKNGDKTDMANYRPICLLTSFSKIFEKVIFNRLQHHLDLNNILAQEQYRFHTNLSMDLATFDLINNILLAHNNKLAVGGLFCDLTKAFDCVNHEILLAKLEFYGINGVTEKLIKSYLTDRHQRTLINNNSSVGVSDWQKVKQGVPQGSILGPLIFLIYINDLHYIINKTSKPILYADDTSILCVNSNPSELVTAIQGILGIINEWVSINSLTLNLDKTNCVSFHRHQIYQRS
jgi:hypothetical protein